MTFANTAVLRFYAGLADLLPPGRRGRAFEHHFGTGTTVKDLVEGLGVPHTEVDLVLVDGTAVDFGYRVQDGDRVAVFPRFETLAPPRRVRLQPVPPRDLRFIADVHLGRLASLLRLLGFDVAWRNDAGDEELAATSAAEDRVLLTRDRGLLKRSAVRQGRLVRAVHPEEQLAEIAARYDLGPLARPFTRCPVCNLVLAPAEADGPELAARVPPRVRARISGFRLCPSCGRVYWRGSHVDRMERLFSRVLGTRGVSRGTRTASRGRSRP